MADQQGSTPDRGSNLVQDFINQLRGMIEGLENLTGVRDQIPSALSAFSLPGWRNLPMPGALTSGQFNSIASSVAAQRRSIEAMKAQLNSFDEQLAVLERVLGPLAEWSTRWAEFEERLTRLGRGPAAGGHAGS